MDGVSQSQPKEQFTCSNVAEHENRKPVSSNKRGKCPQCHRPMFRTRDVHWEKLGK
jgi:uncharacterized paraquat-inducible protein A